MAILIAFLIGTATGFAFLAMVIAHKRKNDGVPYGWAARDEDGELWHYDDEPQKDIESGTWTSGTGARQIYPEQFSGIRCTDARATRMFLTIDTERRGDEE